MKRFFSFAITALWLMCLVAGFLFIFSPLEHFNFAYRIAFVLSQWFACTITLALILNN